MPNCRKKKKPHRPFDLWGCAYIQLATFAAAGAFGLLLGSLFLHVHFLLFSSARLYGPKEPLPPRPAGDTGKHSRRHLSIPVAGKRLAVRFSALSPKLPGSVHQHHQAEGRQSQAGHSLKWPDTRSVFLPNRRSRPAPRYSWLLPSFHTAETKCRRLLRRSISGV
jgi:hypothetical protein